MNLEVFNRVNWKVMQKCYMYNFHSFIYVIHKHVTISLRVNLFAQKLCYIDIRLLNLHSEFHIFIQLFTSIYFIIMFKRNLITRADVTEAVTQSAECIQNGLH